MGKKILVVDDGPEVIALYTNVLTKKGFEVIAAQDGEQALEKVVREKPDLILLDNVMPNIDGAEVAGALKKHAATKHIPIVMVSGKGEMVYLPAVDKFKWMPNNPMARKSSKISDEKTAERLAKEFGVDDYVQKPIEWGNLLDVINRVLEKPLHKPENHSAED